MATFPSPLPVLLPDNAHLDVESLHHTEDAMAVVAGAAGITAAKSQFASIQKASCRKMRSEAPASVGAMRLACRYR